MRVASTRTAALPTARLAFLPLLVGGLCVRVWKQIRCGQVNRESRVPETPAGDGAMRQEGKATGHVSVPTLWTMDGPAGEPWGQAASSPTPTSKGAAVLIPQSCSSLVESSCQGLAISWSLWPVQQRAEGQAQSCTQSRAVSPGVLR